MLSILILLSDDDDMLAVCGTSGQGEIVVEGNKVRIYNETHADMFYNRPDGKKQHERAKKAIDHQVGYVFYSFGPKMRLG